MATNGYRYPSARSVDKDPRSSAQWGMIFRVGDIMSYLAHFDAKPDVCGGETVIRGTRVTLRTLLASLADGDSIAEVLAAYPTISEEDLHAVIAFAAASAEEDLPIPAIPKVA
jgi:uncharacterized protein (DUF433 family)